MKCIGKQKKVFHVQLLRILIIMSILAIRMFFGEDILNLSQNENNIVATNQTDVYLNTEDIPEYTDKIYVEIEGKLYNTEEYVEF